MAVHRYGAVCTHVDGDRIHNLITSRSFGLLQLVAAWQQIEILLAGIGYPSQTKAVFTLVNARHGVARPIRPDIRSFGRAPLGKPQRGASHRNADVGSIQFGDADTGLLLVVVVDIPQVVAQRGVVGHGHFQEAQVFTIGGDGQIVVPVVISFPIRYRIMTRKHHIQRLGFLVRAVLTGFLAWRNELRDFVDVVRIQLHLAGVAGRARGEVVYHGLVHSAGTGSLACGWVRRAALGQIHVHCLHFEHRVGARPAGIAINVLVDLQGVAVECHATLGRFHRSGDSGGITALACIYAFKRNHIAAHGSLDGLSGFELHGRLVCDGDGPLVRNEEDQFLGIRLI